ncbi:MAG: lipid-binding SYLF domain-containing protein [Syntrophobacteraceae bacterium]
MGHRITAALLLLTFGLFFLPVCSDSGTTEEAKVHTATAVVKEIMEIPESSIPPSLLQNAHGIAIFPDLFKAGFIVGGRYGLGVFLVRLEDRTWSNPVFFSIVGPSLGLQFGAQVSDVILVFNSVRSLDYITSGKFTLGLDASVAAGPVGRHAEAGTDVRFRAEILSYSRSRGLFAGVALEGAAMQVEYEANTAFYNAPGLLPMEIFKNRNLQAPVVAGDLRSVLNYYAR